MTATYSFVLVNPGTPEERSEKRWICTCNGALTALLHICPGPLGVSTVTGSPIYRTRVDLLAAVNAAGWKRWPNEEEGVTDYCPLSALLLGL